MIKMSLFRGPLLVVIAVAVSSCALSKLEDDLTQYQEVAHVFSGKVSAKDFETTAMFVIALRDQQGDQIAAVRAVSKSGEFEIKSNPQPLWFFAFDDLNSDSAFQADEPYGWGNDRQAADPAIAATTQLNIEIALANDNMPPAPVGFINISLIGKASDIVQFVPPGTVSSLSDPLFSEEQAKKGQTQPFAFLADGGTGIHFMEDYDPTRIPVLFVHGVNGTPRNFAVMIESLDRSRYQAWVFSYPSGFRLSVLANGMHQFLNFLQRKYLFDQLHIIAHSMGGLVSRGGANNCLEDDTCDYLRSFTTISTPWNGVASAKSGVELLPEDYVVPVWRDLDPGSNFVTTLFDKPLPEGVPHYLIFGYRQDSIFGSESSDGVIKLSSQLRIVAQEQAKQVRGYDEEHVSILSNEAVIAKVNEILDSNSQ